MREKKPLGEIILGICAKGVIVYEIKDGCRSTSQTFYWRETATISSNSRGSKKKYTFITEKSKIAKYLCNLCSAQHKFNNEMNSRKLNHNLVSDENLQYAVVCHAQSSRLKCFSCSETLQDNSGLTAPQNDSMIKLCDDIAARIEAPIKQQHQSLNEQSTCSSSQRSSVDMRSPACSQRSGSEAPSTSPAARETPPRVTSCEREVICVSLKKDPKLGLGILIVGEDSVGRYDLGIFVASIVPGGPADKDGRVRPGGRLISLNHVSLEGVSFSEATEVMQSSPEEVQLIISQPKVALSPSSNRSAMLKNFKSQNMLLTDGRSADDNLDEIVSAIMTPKTCNRLSVPQDVRILNAQDGCSLLSSLNCMRPEGFTVELGKIAGSLGISISGGVGTSLPNGGIYIKSLVPGGAAERDGRIHTGDRLLEVDGISFQGFTYQQAVECLSKTEEMVSLVLERDLMMQSRGPVSSVYLSPGSISSTPSQLRNNSCPAIITISNQPRDYSFVTDDNTLEVTDEGRQWSGLQLPHPAQQSGRIQEGDVILAINGQSIKELSYPRVLKLFKNSPPEVHLALCRPAPGILPSMEQFTGT
ncbi:hypothetical protein LDENG_00076720 [Lucifuga dentata]|nr:hypothetical protein LDENG_00076720 [Lucifuga dentata]